MMLNISGDSEQKFLKSYKFMHVVNESFRKVQRNNGNAYLI
jgi:hypothetical protein